MTFQDYPLLEDIQIEITETEVIPTKWKLGIDKDNLEKRILIGFKAKVLNYSKRQTIDFNNLSLVDKGNGVRHLAFQISQLKTQHSVYQTRLENFKREDNFIKYSQDGITNYKQYRTYFYSDRNLPNTEHRFDLESFRPKRKKGYIEFRFLFPAFKTKKDSGEFLIYWKDKLIGEFNIYEGKTKK